jgi:hypothetical protein
MIDINIIKCIKCIKIYLHADFAVKQRIDVIGVPDLEAQMDTSKHTLDHMMVHVEEPVAVHRIRSTEEVPVGR